MDLSEIGKMRAGVSDNPWMERVKKEPHVIYGAWLKTYRPTKPVILAAEGFARAGGTEILQGTDIRVAGESAKFGVTEVQRGLFPMAGSAVRLRRQIPYAIAAEMLLAGEDLPARRAYELGLVNHVVPDGQALAKAKEIAQRIAANGPLAVKGDPRHAARDRGDARRRRLRDRAEVRHAGDDVGRRRRGPARVPREAEARVHREIARPLPRAPATLAARGTAGDVRHAQPVGAVRDLLRLGLRGARLRGDVDAELRARARQLHARRGARARHLLPRHGRGQLGGRRIAATTRAAALRSYAWIELAVAAAALLVLGWLALYHAVYPALYRATFESPGALSALQLGLAALALGPPCIGMGATLPLMSRAVVSSEAHLGRRLGFVYALNTFGGVAGVLLVGLLAAGRGRCAGQHVRRGRCSTSSPRSRRSRGRARPRRRRSAARRPAPAPARPPARLGPLAFVATASGLGTLALEVLFTRLLVNAMDSSVFSFTLVLATFLVSLALGSALVSALVDRLRSPWIAHRRGLLARRRRHPARAALCTRVWLWTGRGALAGAARSARRGAAPRRLRS